MNSRVRVLALLLALVVALGGTIALALQSGGGQDGDGSSDSEASSTFDPADVPDVVATVDGVEITREDFERSYTAQLQIAQQQQAQSSGQVDQKQLAEQVAGSLVDNQLLIAEAENRDFDVSENDVDAELAALAEENGMESPEALIEALTQQGLDASQVDQQVEQQILIERLIADEGGDDLAPSEEDLRKVYDQVVAQQGEGGEVPSFEEARPQLEEQGRQENENAVATTLVEQLRKDADIDILI